MKCWISLLAISTLAATTMADEAKLPAPTPAMTTTTMSLSPAPTPATSTTASYPAPTPATTSTTYPAPTPASSKLGSPCWEVSVEHDATYRVQGPPCSGRGPEPAGILCPKKGDVAIADCWKYLESYVEGARCVAPVDAKCRVIGTGAWGCVWEGAGPIYLETPKPTPASSVTNDPKPTPAASAMDGPKPTPAGSIMASPTPTPAATGNTNTAQPKLLDSATTGKKGDTIPVSAANFQATLTSSPEVQGDSRTATTLSAGASTPTADTSSVWIGVVLASAGVALVAIGAIYYLRRKNKFDDFTMGTPHGALAGDKKGANALLSLPRQTTIAA